MKNALIVDLFTRCMDARGIVSYQDMKYCLKMTEELLDVIYGPKEMPAEIKEEKSLTEELAANPPKRGRAKKLVAVEDSTHGDDIAPVVDTIALGEVITSLPIVLKSPEMPHAPAIETKRELVAAALEVPKEAVKALSDDAVRLWNPEYPSDRVLVGKALGRAGVTPEWLAKHKSPLETYLKFHAAKACEESVNPLVTRYVAGVEK